MTEIQKIVEPVRKTIIGLIQYFSHFYRTEKKDCRASAEKLSMYSLVFLRLCVMDGDIPKLVFTAVTVCQ